MPYALPPPERAIADALDAVVRGDRRDFDKALRSFEAHSSATLLVTYHSVRSLLASLDPMSVNAAVAAACASLGALADVLPPDVADSLVGQALGRVPVPERSAHAALAPSAVALLIGLARWQESQSAGARPAATTLAGFLAALD